MKNSKPARFLLSLFVASCVALALSGCGGTETYSLSGTISGLSGSGLVVTATAGSQSIDVPITAGNDGPITQIFAASIANGAEYSLTVKTQPAGETCSVARGTGTISWANVANVVVNCSDQAFALGGTISGLTHSGLVLVNGSDTVSAASGASSFTMPARVAYTSSYDVTVKTQPAGLACSVSQGTGSMPAGAVTDVTVSCTDQPFTVGGSIAGLGDNSGLILTNGGSTLPVPANATGFTMPTAVAFGSAYAVRVQGSPAGLTCSAANAAGTMGAGNVSNIVVTCSDRAFTLGGTISGLTRSGLVLANGSDTFDVVAGATSFTMPEPVAYRGSYSVRVQTNPTGETCTPSSDSGTMPAGAVNSVRVTCSVSTYTVGGSISNATTLSLNNLVLLDNGGDATSIAAHAASFTMHTGVAYGAPYVVTVGRQPYGISLACTPTSNSGTVVGTVNSVAISCATAALIQKLISAHFDGATGVAVDANGNVFVAEFANNTVEEIPYSAGNYGTPVKLGSGFNSPTGVAVDATGNVFVADLNNNAVKEIPYSAGGYGTPVSLGSGFSYPQGVAVDANGNVFVADTGHSAVKKIPITAGSYGTPVSLGSGFSYPRGVAVDANGNVFVADHDNDAVKEIPYNAGSYGTPVILGSGFYRPTGVAVDANGNVFVADNNNSAVKEIPNTAGIYGTPVTLGSGFSDPFGVAVDANGNVFVGDSGEVTQIPYSAGSYGAPVNLESGFRGPFGVAVDANGNVFVADTGHSAVKEIPYSDAGYGAPVSLGSGFSYPESVAVDANGNVFVADSGNNAVKEIPYSAVGYGVPVSLSSGFSYPYGVAVDANGNVFVADTGNNAVQEIPHSAGGYGTPVSLGSGFSYPYDVAVDANGNVYVADTGNSAVQKMSYSAGGYGAPVSVGSGFSYPEGVAVDANGNVFVADSGNDAVKEIPYSGGYGAPLSLGAGINLPSRVAVDANGRVYVLDSDAIWMFSP